MEVKDKLVTLEDQKIAFDNLNGKISTLSTQVSTNTSAISTLNSNLNGKGSSTTPVYINSNGVATPISYSISKSVPSNAVFTDTNTWRGIQNNLMSTSTSDSLSAYQGKILNDTIKPIGTSYWSGGGRSFYHNGNGWKDTSIGINIPDGTYMFSITMSPCTTNNLYWDYASIGVKNIGSYESQCSFNLMANNNNFYPRCSHLFFSFVNAGTYYVSIWSQAARQINEIEIAALRIK